MNRRSFISLLAGAAGAPLVPWRGLIEPVIFLPPRPRYVFNRGNENPIPSLAALFKAEDWQCDRDSFVRQSILG
jgi:hypothetical protein